MENKSVNTVDNTTNPRSTFDASWFARDHRIHIEDGSLFTGDHRLIIHPKELAAENQERLQAKILKHYSLPAPSYFAFSPRNIVMLSLAEYLPISNDSRLDNIKAETEKLNQAEQTGIHPDTQDRLNQYDNPLAAYAKLRSEGPELKAIEKEYLTSAVELYLVINEALTQRGRPDEAAAYVHHLSSPDVVLADLCPKLGIDFTDFVNTAHRKDVDGVAELLGVSKDKLTVIKEVATMASQHYFANNLIQSWQVGKQVPGSEGKELTDVIAIGTMQRAGTMLQQLQRHISPDQPLPQDVQKAEKQIVSMIRELPEELQKALYYRGAEFGFTRASRIDRLDPTLPGALGIHIPIPYEPGGHDGMLQILVSNMDHVSEARRFFHHEAHHLFFPKQFSGEQIEQLDMLMRKGASRTEKLKHKLDEWALHRKDPERQQQIMEEIDRDFRVGEIGLKQAIGDGDTDAKMQQLHRFADYAHRNLDPHSLSLSRGYPTPELRAAEIISRFSEMYYVDLVDNPAMLSFIAPEMMVAYHDHYLPHLAEQNKLFEQEQAQLPEQLRYQGLPAKTDHLPTTQQEALDYHQPKLNALVTSPETPAAPVTTAPEPQVDAATVSAVQESIHQHKHSLTHQAAVSAR